VYFIDNFIFYAYNKINDTCSVKHGSHTDYKRDGGSIMTEIKETVLTEDSTLSDNVNLEDEGLNSDFEGDVADETENAASDDEGIENKSAEEGSENSEESPVVFSKKQQDEINKLVKTRLDRQEAKFVKDFTKAAGVELAQTEISSAARLWGLLKSNPQLSKDIDDIISSALSKGDVKIPVDSENTTDAVTQRLELKEAILDLRASNKLFEKNADKVIAWAENEGYKVNNAQALKMAFLAWKGAQGKVEEAVQKAQEKRKEDTKKVLQKRATVQSTKTGTQGKGVLDYANMSDVSILASENLKLFIDD